MRNKLLFVGSTLTDADIAGGVTASWDINPTKNLSVGNVCCGQLSFVVRGNVVAIGDEFDYQCKFIDDDTFTTLGHYIVTGIEKLATNSYSITAQDNIYKFQKKCDDFFNTRTPSTIGNLFTSLCTYCGCTAESASFTNSTFTELALRTSETKSVEILNMIAAIAGGFIWANASGNIEVKKFTSTSKTLTSHDYSHILQADYVVDKISKVILKKDDNDVGISAGTGSNVLRINGSNLFQSLSTSQTAVTNIYNQIKDYQYCPTSISLFTDNGLNVGDIFTVNSRPVYVFSKRISKTGVVIECTGEKIRDTTDSVSMSPIRKIESKTNTLERTLDETVSEIHDPDTGLSKVRQTANSVSAEVTTARSTYSSLNDRLNNIVITGSGNRTYRQSTAPTTDIKAGDLWFDTTNSKWKRYNGTSWDVMTDGDIASVTQAAAELRVDVDEISGTVAEHTTEIAGQDSRITDAESTITQHSTEIAAKASQTQVDNLTITVNGKASQSDLEDLEDVVDGKASQIALDLLEAEVSGKADSGVVTAINTRLTTAEADIDAAEAAITLKADSSTVTELTGVVNGKADKTTVTALDQRVAGAEADIDGLEGAITLKASVQELNRVETKVDGKADSSTVVAMNTRLTQAELDIDAAEGQIATKVSQTEFDGLSGRVSDAESTITQHATEIATKVSKGGVISSINQTPESITINAARINLSGVTTFVKPSDLSSTGTTEIYGNRIKSGYLQSDNFVSAQQYSTSGSRINLINGEIKTPAFEVTSSGNVSLTGSVTATAGKIGPLSIQGSGKQLNYGTSSAANHFRLTTGDSPTPLSVDMLSTVGGNRAGLKIADGAAGVSGVPAGILDGREWYVYVPANGIDATWGTDHYINLATLIGKLFDQMGWDEPTSLYASSW